MASDDVKTGAVPGLREQCRRHLVYDRHDIRPLGGASSDQAQTWNLGTCRLDGKGKAQAEPPRGSVPMRGTGAERLVVALNGLQWVGSEGVVSSSSQATGQSRVIGRGIHD